MYRVNLKSGVIHATCAEMKKNGKHFADVKTISEANATVRSKGKAPLLCKHCKFRDELQKEISL